MNRVPMSDIVKRGIKNTVGFVESANSIEFMKGANIAYSRAEDYYSKEIHQLQLRLDNATKALETITKVCNIANTLKRYSE